MTWPSGHPVQTGRRRSWRPTMIFMPGDGWSATYPTQNAARGPTSASRGSRLRGARIWSVAPRLPGSSRRNESTLPRQRPPRSSPLAPGPRPGKFVLCSRPAAAPAAGTTELAKVRCRASVLCLTRPATCLAVEVVAATGGPAVAHVKQRGLAPLARRSWAQAAYPSAVSSSSLPLADNTSSGGRRTLAAAWVVSSSVTADGLPRT